MGMMSSKSTDAMRLCAFQYLHLHFLSMASRTEKEDQGNAIGGKENTMETKENGNTSKESENRNEVIEGTNGTTGNKDAENVDGNKEHENVGKPTEGDQREPLNETRREDPVSQANDTTTTNQINTNEITTTNQINTTTNTNTTTNQPTTNTTTNTNTNTNNTTTDETNNTITTNTTKTAAWTGLARDIDSICAAAASSPALRRHSVDLFRLNVVRGRGLVARSVLSRAMRQPQAAAPLAALVGVLNLQLPQVGGLVAARTAALFKRAYMRNDGRGVDAAAAFLAELVRFAVATDTVLLQVFQLLLERPSDDTVRVATALLRRLGSWMDAHAPAAADMIWGRLRDVLHEGQALAQAMRRITELMRARRDGLGPAVPRHLDVVPAEDVQPHDVDLAEPQPVEAHLDWFDPTEDVAAADAAYAALRAEILDDDETTEQDNEQANQQIIQTKEAVTDMTDATLLQHQKSIYLTVMSSMSADEAVHKLLRLQRSAQLSDAVMTDMLVKCCAQEKTYSKYFGVLGEKLCGSSRRWHAAFVAQFRRSYDALYQHEGAQLRNMGKYFGHLVAADVLAPHETLGVITLTETDTSSASRVFIKFLFQELVEELGVDSLKRLLLDPDVRVHLRGLFPVVDVSRADADHIMFSINYFTAIGLGVLTEEMRLVLKALPEDRGRKRSRGSFSSREGSYSRSRSGSYSRSRSGSYASSRSYSRSRSASYSRSPLQRSFSRSPSNALQRSFSRSPSRSPRHDAPQ